MNFWPLLLPLNTFFYCIYYTIFEELPKTNLTEEDFSRFLPWNPEVKTDLDILAEKLLKDE